MAHLVNNIDQPLDATMSVSSVLEQLRAAHQYLVQLGVIALQSVSEIEVL